jgi:hypothetical protein
VIPCRNGSPRSGCGLIYQPRRCPANQVQTLVWSQQNRLNYIKRVPRAGGAHLRCARRKKGFAPRLEASPQNIYQAQTELVALGAIHEVEERLSRFAAADIF